MKPRLEKPPYTKEEYDRKRRVITRFMELERGNRHNFYEMLFLVVSEEVLRERQELTSMKKES